MKFISKLINFVLWLGILVTLISALGSAITKEPVLLSVIRSNSMYPVWERGDMILIENLNDEKELKIGDIIFFKAEAGNLSNKGWIAHRIMEGDAEKGYITKGDANEHTDQLADGAEPIQRKLIAARAFTIGGQPIVIPKLGFLSLWAEEFKTNPFVLPGVAVVLAIIIGVSEMKSGKKRKKRDSSLEVPLIYIIAGLTVSVILATTMMLTSQKLNLTYEVSESKKGAIMGSQVGIMKVGDEVTNPLTKLTNGGIFKLIGTTTTNDDQITISHDKVMLSKNEVIDLTYTVKAKKPGKYKSSMHVGLFYPILPSSVIYFLASKSYWLALAVTSIIPSLPLILYPFFNQRMRRKMTRAIIKKKNKLLARLPI